MRYTERCKWRGRLQIQHTDTRGPSGLQVKRTHSRGLPTQGERWSLASSQSDTRVPKGSKESGRRQPHERLQRESAHALEGGKKKQSGRDSNGSELMATLADMRTSGRGALRARVNAMAFEERLQGDAPISRCHMSGCRRRKRR